MPDRQDARSAAQGHRPGCASLDRLHDPGPEGEGTFDERGWYHPPCDCGASSAAMGRQRPREETEARLLRERGTPEERIGPVVPDGTLYPDPHAAMGVPRQ